MRTGLRLKRIFLVVPLMRSSCALRHLLGRNQRCPVIRIANDFRHDGLAPLAPQTALPQNALVRMTAWILSRLGQVSRLALITLPVAA
jgi:hypothetical protein